MTKRAHRGAPPHRAQAGAEHAERQAFFVNREESSVAHGRKNYRDIYQLISETRIKRGYFEFSNSFSSGSRVHESMGRPMCEGAWG